MDEEILKCNTDCVYFLASPLTCKKGINCEFRHSEAARLHPRDCWYWLGGNCLNARCPFRHPPLDGRSASVSASTPASFLSSKAASASTISTSVPASKCKTPCYFFSQGYCSKGNRCAFLHGSVLSTSAKPAVIHQKLPEASTGKGLETDKKPMNVVELNGSSAHTKFEAGITSADTLPSHVFIRAQKMPFIDNDAPLPKSSKKALASKCSNVQAPSVKMLSPPDLHDRGHAVHQSVQARKNSSPDSHDMGQYKQWQRQPNEHWAEMARSAETMELSQGTISQKKTWSQRLSEDICARFVEDEFDKTFYSEDIRYLPHCVARRLSPRRADSHKDAHDFGQAGSEMYSFPLLWENELSEQLYGFNCQQSLTNLRGRHHSPPYLGRGDGHKIKDLRDCLGKRRFSYQDRFSGFNGHFGAIEGNGYFDERDWIDSMESAPSDSDQETYWRKFKRAVRRRVESPTYDFGWGSEAENAEFSSESLPHMYAARECPTSMPYSSEGGRYSSRRARCHLELDRGRPLQTWLGGPVNVVSGSCSSYVARPSVKSRILSASEGDQVVQVLDDFEGPKPLSILLQEKQRVK